VKAGTSIWIAPEGTRSSSGELGTFKKGGFHMATGAEARILPVTVIGTEAVLPAKGKSVVDGKHVKVVVSPPVDPKEYGKRINELMGEVRNRMMSGFGG